MYLNHTWNGGQCLRECSEISSDPCTAQQVRMRFPSTDAAGSCYAFKCFNGSNAALRHIVEGNYAVWRLSRCATSGLYVDNIDLLHYDKQLACAGDAATGVTGLGIIAECVADALGLESRQKQQERILLTLETLAG